MLIVNTEQVLSLSTLSTLLHSQWHVSFCVGGR